MANYFNYLVPIQTTSIKQLTENLYILLSELFFIRDLNMATPVYASSDMYDMDYIAHTNKHIAYAIDASIIAFKNAFIKKNKKYGILIVGFYEPSKKQSVFDNTNKIYWEKWNFGYNVNTESTRCNTSLYANALQKIELLEARRFIQLQSIQHIDKMPALKLDDVVLTPNSTPPTTPEKHYKPISPILTGVIPKLEPDIVYITPKIEKNKPSYNFNISFTFDNDVNLLNLMNIELPFHL